MRYVVDTTVDITAGRIEQLVRGPISDVERVPDIYAETSRRIMDTLEAQTRAALIQLGWTPPSDTITSKGDTPQ